MRRHLHELQRKLPPASPRQPWLLVDATQGRQEFDPPARLVDAPPDASGQDFTIGGIASEMVYIPAGEFQMGCDPAVEPVCGGDVLLHPVYLDAYFVDKAEVTNRKGCWT